MNGEWFFRKMKNSRDTVQRIKWMLTRKSATKAVQPGGTKSQIPSYGDLTSLNTSRLILDSVGTSLLSDIIVGFMDLLDTSCAVYEKNGDYALGIFSSSWCRFMDQASRRQCNTTDNQEAINSGKWHCHESCWNEAALRSIQTKKPADVACRGGIRLFAVPIFAGEEIVGSISAGYGDPPGDPKKLNELATLYGVNANDLRRQAEEYEMRPSFIIELAKKRILSSARLIGEMVKRTQAEQALRKSEEKFRALFDFAKDAIFIHDLEGHIQEANREACERLGYSRDEFLKMTPLDVDISEQAVLFPERIETLRKQGHLLFETVHQKRDGSSIPVEVSAQLFELAGEQISLAVCRDITERKRAEEALKESENRFKSLVMNSSDTITVLAADAIVTYQSPSLKRIFGYEPEDLIGKNVFSYMHPDDIHTVQSAFTQALEHPGESVSVEFRFRHANGSWIFVEAIGRNFLDDPAVQGVVVNARDISKRKQAEEALRENEERFRLLVKNSSDIMGIIDPDGRQRYVSDAAERITGFPARELASKNISEVIHPDDISKVLEAFKFCIDHPDQIVKTDYRHIHKSKGWVYFEALGQSFIDDTSVRGVVSNVRDITERKQAEEALRDASEKRKELEFIVNQSPAIVCLWKAEEGWPVEYVSENITNFGYTPDDLISGRISYGSIVHPDDLSRVGDEVLRYTREGKSNFSQEYRIISKTGGIHHIDDRTWVRRSADGTVTHYQGIIIDITDRKQADAALKESEAKFRALTESSSAAIFLIQGTKYIYINPAFESIVGYTMKDLANMNFWDFMHPDSRKLVKERGLSRLEGENPPSRYEIKFISKDGQEKWVDFSAGLIELNNKPTILGSTFDITDRKRAEQALEKRIIALTQPLEDIQNIAFEDLFNLADIQRLQDRFAQAWGVAAIITRPDGTPITQPTTFSRFCKDIIRKHPKSLKNCEMSNAIIGRHNPSGPIIQPCLSAGLCNAGASITVGGCHIANWLIGEVRNEAQNEEQIMEYAREIGADEKEFREAYREVPVMSQEKFEQIAHALFALVNQLSTTAYQNIQQARFIAERKQAEDALRESEERFRRVVESSPLAIGIADQDARIEYLNPKFIEKFGYTMEEIPTLMDWYHRAFPDPDYRQRLLESLQKALERPEDKTIAAQGIESEITCKDGFVRTVEVFRTRMGNRMLAVLNDLTERRRLEEERLKFDAQMREVQKLESLGVLAGGIAHDFNNLLMAVLGNADLAILSLSPAAPAYEYVEDIIRASQRAGDLCRQMLAYSGKGRFVVSRYDISEIVREMGQILNVSVSKKAMLRYFLAEGLPAVELDATQIRQVIMNLITNASDAIGNTNGVISVTTGVMECDESYLAESYLVDTLPGGTFVFLEVSDTGCGMDAETRSKIFDPFYSTKFTGRGLGLAAVLGIVRGHKGAIKVYSEVGKGTTFKILLPAVEGKPVEKEKIVEQSGSFQGGGTILLVDDDPYVCKVASGMLVKLGFQVLTAVNGREGLNIFRTHGAEIACVILDLTMPEMGGEETFREMRNLRKDIRVILSSGYNEQDVTQRFVGKGLAGFIQKPYTTANLQAALSRALG